MSESKEPVAATHKHKFRYLLPPGNNFAFVAKFRIWLIVSCLLMAASIGSLFVNKAVRGQYMNWTIDFKGGTEIQFAFKDKATNSYVRVDPAKVREALAKSGEEGLDVSDISWDDDAGRHIEGMVVRSPKFTTLTEAQQDAAQKDFMDAFGTKYGVEKAYWSGDRLYVKAKKPIPNADAAPVFAKATLELKPWNEHDTTQYTTADEGTGEF